MKKEELKKEFESGIVVITKDNIHLYYEFMSDEDIYKNSRIIDEVLGNRIILINKQIMISKNVVSSFLKYKKGNDKIETYFYTQSIFGIKDTLRPLEEYIEEIKASSEYKEYIKA